MALCPAPGPRWVTPPAGQWAVVPLSQEGGQAGWDHDHQGPTVPPARLGTRRAWDRAAPHTLCTSRVATGWPGLRGPDEMTLPTQQRFSSNELEFWWFLLIPLCLPQSAVEGRLTWLSFFL